MPAPRRPTSRFQSAIVAIFFAQCAASSGLIAAEAIDFPSQIQPIFVKHCLECHGPKRGEGGLRLTAREVALAGGDSGQKVIVPGDAKASRLIRVVDGSDPELKMPPEGEAPPLSEAQVKLLAQWINEGAEWPSAAMIALATPDHWAWKTPSKSPLPSVKQAKWPRHAIDYFVLAQLEQGGIQPAAEADRYTLARRVYLDLTGLPPTIAEVDAFVNDSRPGAYERMVDRALADPAYGERWARMWLDLARYADSKGYGSDPLRTIWRYRDWVIEAFNQNLPYDQFTIHQLAGDLLPNPTEDQILATAFHRNTMANDEGGTDDEEFRVAAVKDRIETTMQVWMGLTMGCAKCHSHKFDPITQREYYQGYAFFDQTEDADRGDEEPKVRIATRVQKQQIESRRQRLADLNQSLSTPPGNLDQQLANWEQAVRQQSSEWQVLTPSEAAADDATKLTTLDDHSILASDARGDVATYAVTVASELELIREPAGTVPILRRPGSKMGLSPSPRRFSDRLLKGITAFRLEALADESLPQNGPGRAGGNFVLNDFRVSVTPASATPLSARYVRIELRGAKQILSLAEVEAFSDGKNIASQGKATQSSTAFGGAAGRAIDGKTAGDFQQNSVTHTNTEDNPWFEIDLGRAATLDRLAIWNRTDGGLQSRLKNFRVQVLDEKRQPIWQRTIAEPPKPSMQLDLSGPTEVELADATSDFAQDGWPASNAIDPDASAASGWAISPQVGRSHELVMHTKRPLASGGPLTLRFTLTQSHGAQHTLGRFRLSASTAQPAPDALPILVQEILTKDAAQRSPEEKAELTSYYWSHSPAAQAIRDEIAQIEGQIKEIEKQVPATPIMRELAAGKRRETHTMFKGNFRMPGDVVEAAVPIAFHPLPAASEKNRLTLARWLIDRGNPLTARVAVNRFWAQLFGTGLVATEEDFGTQGLPPTHPEVLDWLAVEFRDGGWDIKSLLRQIVTSATYRQSSSPSPDVLRKDGANKLLSRGPRFRLEAEMVRDQALAISGLLSRKQLGPSVYPPQPPNLWRAAFNGERTWATSAGEDRYRRGLYTYWRRTVPYPSMAAFDAPSREICTLRRISTNTPLQAFVTLNDPVYVEAAQALARRILAEGGKSLEERSAFVLRLALGRPAQQEQIDQVAALYRDEYQYYGGDNSAAQQMATEPIGPAADDADLAQLAAWTVVSNVILNLDGVLTKR